MACRPIEGFPTLALEIGFDLTGTLRHKCIVGSMGSPVQRWCRPESAGFGRGKEEAVAAKIVDPDPFASDCFDHPPQRVVAQQLQWQEVVALHIGLEATLAALVHVAECQGKSPNIGGACARGCPRVV